MKRVVLVILGAALTGLAGPARSDPSPETQIPGVQAPAAPAQNAPAETAAEGRYTFHRMGEGFVRLDSRTGQLAQCGWAAAGWSCKAVPDERAALDSEIARLQRENAALKKSLLSRGLELPAGVLADAAPPRASADRPTPPANVPDASRDTTQPPRMPSEADLDRAIAYMKNVWRKLVDMMIDLQRDIQRKS